MLCPQKVAPTEKLPGPPWACYQAQAQAQMLLQISFICPHKSDIKVAKLLPTSRPLAGKAPKDEPGLIQEGH